LQELENGEDDTLDVNMELASVVVNEPRLKVDLTKFVERHTFSFDDCLSEAVTNDEVYKITVQPLVATIFRQGKATCFAYGQTGSGKTYTMQVIPIAPHQ
jgi:kinesin family protein 2/24